MITQTVHAWKNESVGYLLEFLHELLPPNSTFPTKWRECKMKISNIGLRYETIHTCVNGCALFHKNLASETNCPKCKEGRYKPGLKSNSTPRKVRRHFPKNIN